MHIADGVLPVSVVIGGGVVSAAGVAVGLSRLKDSQIPRAALIASVIFVGSVVIRLPFGPSSAHPLLNGLAGLVLGWAALPVILVALFLQTLLFQFGGVTTLGVNVLTLGAPAVLCYFIYGPLIRRATGAKTAFAIGVATAVTATLLSFLLWFAALATRGEDLLAVARVAAVPHMLMVGIEGVFTGFVVSFLHRVSPGVFRMRNAELGMRNSGTGRDG
jgi:cobalt/nickel transport system permease protein